MTLAVPVAAPQTRLAGQADGLALGRARMAALGQPPEAIQAFSHYYRLLRAGASGFIDARQIAPVERLTDYEELDGYEMIGHELIDKAVILKLNGGLGTTMGLDMPRCLMPVKPGQTFLDYTVDQVMHLRRQLGKQLPLLFMNSFHTRAATREALTAYPQLRNGIGLDFEQHRMPRLDAETLAPAVWPADPAKEWSPPGHGDLYAALRTSGALDALIDAGYEYAFISNSDNLGATLDLKILGYMATYAASLLMEVAYRTPSDRKGGHLAQNRASGQLLIREYAQCPADERAQFQDVKTFQFFNTNNIWVRLPDIRDYLAQHDGFIRLTPIFNRKPVDPAAAGAPQVIQLESALGSAISVLPNAAAIRVPRNRFLPVKHCADLLVLQSDVYQRNSQSRLVMNPKRVTADPPRRAPLVALDPAFYGAHAALARRFPFGPPSLVRCESLRVQGDVTFGRNVVIEGRAAILNDSGAPYRVPDDALIRGECRVGAADIRKNAVPRAANGD